MAKTLAIVLITMVKLSINGTLSVSSGEKYF